MKRNLSRSLFIGSALVTMFAVYPASGDTDAPAAKIIEPDKPLKLRGIMQEMGRNMQLAEDTAAQQDWEGVARAAEKLRDHPKPPMSEGFRIMAFAGSDIGRFREIDKRNKKLANQLVKFAQQGQADQAGPALSELKENCQTCHRSFRKSLQRHFYGEEWLAQPGLSGAE